MYLIVGATSRLGSLMARRLLVEGKPIRAMARIPTDMRETLKLYPVKLTRQEDYARRAYAQVAD